jgi:hypothetical protein
MGDPTDIVNGAIVPLGLYGFATFPSSTYYWRVRPFNAAGAATGCTVNTLTTTAGSGVVSTFPHMQTFGTSNTIPAGWTQDPADANESWVFATSATTVGGPPSDHTTGTGSFAYASDTSPNNDPVNLVSIPFYLTGMTAPRLQFWHSNSSATSNTTDVPILHVDVSTDGAVWTEVASNGAVLQPWTQFTADLTPYAGDSIFVRFRSQEQRAGIDNTPSIDDVSIDEAPTAPIFSMSPTGPVTFGETGPCFTVIARSQAFTITNNGAGTLQVNSATLTGDDAYSLLGSSLPVSLTAGQSTTFTVEFAPQTGDSGALAATLDVEYDLGGGPQTASVSFTGTATTQNVNLGMGAGYLFENSNTACTGGETAPGTALVPFTGHTKLATLTGGTFDDGYFDVDAATLDGLIEGGSFRMFGQTFETLRITTNGNVTFNPPVYNATNDRSVTLPSALHGTLIAGASLDLDTRSTTYGGDNGGIGGTPGIWYGTADVDGDSDDELVITHYHAYKFGSTVYPSPSAQFLTFQIILFDAGEANQEDRYEVRFFDGNDGNGVPFRMNTAGAAIENDAAIGLSNAAGTAAAEYRDNSATGGPLYGSDLGVGFEAEVQAVVDDPVAGWRMMGAPVTAYTVGRLADLNLVEGVVGQYPDTTANVRIDYDGVDWVPAANVTDALVPGQGFMWFLENEDFTPDPGGNGGGTSVSYALPMALEGTGAEVALTGGVYTIPLHAAGKKWNLIANPFRQALDLSGLAGWATGGTLASAVGQIWLPTSESPPYGTYVLTTDPEVNNVISAWQGLVVENEDATALDVPGAARTTGGTFVGRTPGGPLAENVRLLAFALAAGGTARDEARPALDRAAVLYFRPEARDGWDLWDVTKLAPLASAYATIAFGGERDGGAVAKAQESRPFDGEAFEVPIQFEAVGMGEAFTLFWPHVQNVPEAWTLTLRDLVTGAEVDLRQATSYAFEADAAGARQGRNRAVPGLGAAARGTDRFVLRVERIATADYAAESEHGEPVPTTFALRGAAPNPFDGATTLRYDVPEAARVTVEVFDLLGRRVATLVDAEARPGYHSVRWEARGAASGVYVVRMQSETGFVQSRRMTLLK